MSYDHSQKKVDKACNINASMLKYKMEQFNERIKHEEVTSISQIIELHEELFTKRELAFMLAQEKLSNPMAQMMKAMQKASSSQPISDPAFM